jgi:hypothetical protein
VRIIYTFRKKDKFWIVKGASDTTIKESIYKSPIEAVNKFFIAHKFESIENFDIVIPLSGVEDMSQESIAKVKSDVEKASRRLQRLLAHSD